MDPQSNQNQKSIAYLNGKAWYRFLKVLYVLLLIFTILSVMFVGEFSKLSIGFLVIILFLLEIGKRSIYYIITGRVFPSP